MPTVLIIDDHAMFRAGLRMLVHARLVGVNVSEAGTMGEVLETPARPDLILLDIMLPGLNGVEGIDLVQQKWPRTPVVMLSSVNDPDTIDQVLARGARAFVSKAEGADSIIAVIMRELRLDDGALPPPTLTLNPRQREILALIAQGLANRAIADRLGLSENTVRWYVQGILQTLDARNRSEAVFVARNRGLVA